VTTYSLFPGSGPALTAAADTLVVGVAVGASSGGLWLNSYRWWVPTGGDTAAGQKFCLYQITGTAAGIIVPNSTVTAGVLTANAWNVVNLPSPLLLSPAFASDSIATTYGCVYMACTGKSFVNGFPEAKNVFGTGDTNPGGIVNGPLFAFSSQSGTQPAGGTSQWIPQMAFSNSISDPTAGMPTQNDSDANLGMDVVLSTVPPASPTYRMVPNMPVFAPSGSGSPQSLAYTLGLPFTLSAPGQVVRGWHYSPSTATVLPTRVGVWNSGMTEVAACSILSPSWSGAAGSGWVSVTYGSPPALPAGSYVFSTFTADNTDVWFEAQTGWFSTAFPSGITQGIVSYPGPVVYNLGVTWTYPATTNTEYDGIDIEIQPASSSPLASDLGEGANHILGGGILRMGYAGTRVIL